MKRSLRNVCVVIALVWTNAVIGAQGESLPAFGPDSASAPFEVFLDFNGESSTRLAVVLDAMRRRHPDTLRVVFRQLPTEDDAVAELRHRAALAAARQQRFWEMTRLILENQDRVSRDDLLVMASQLKLDIARFTRDLDDAGWAAVIQQDRAYATERGVATAPAVLQNGNVVTDTLTLDTFERLLNASR